ncbi:hypothetical protein [Pseudoduganella sp. GCM10020061]|uniref:hypothetical protein n=1 Tax=Pseudoduganella sp. GCM10020061 TaxID=3317345 RepID=UPI00363327CE
MQNLIAELMRLYLPAGAVTAEALEQHILGPSSEFDLVDADGQVRAIVIPFRKEPGSEDQHWTSLCTVANAIQSELAFPAPAVSVSGGDGYRLWLSLETPVPAAQAQEFVHLLCQAFVPGVEMAAEALDAPIELPPCLSKRTGKWAAFIHPGMGASFAEDAGLEMSPALGGQVAFLEGLLSIGADQFARGLATLGQRMGVAPEVTLAQPQRAVDIDGLLLKDATLEDIVRHLHSKNIEPTFRHVLPPSRH